MPGTKLRTATTLAAIALLSTGCAVGSGPQTAPKATFTPPTIAPTIPTPPAGGASPQRPTEANDARRTGNVQPTGSPTVLADRLSGVPWDIVRLDTGSAFVSFRDRGVVAELTPAGTVRDVATLATNLGSANGLLGIAVRPGNGSTPSYLYAYASSATDNRIVRAPISGNPGSYRLGAVETVFAGLARGGHHSGGRIAFGPDGMLYISVGDAFQSSTAQNLGSTSGKILRITPDGKVPGDNPFAGSPVWSLGHRNVQGIAWGSDGRMWASEFGENHVDELNLIVRGGNYGWPQREGTRGATNPNYIDPYVTWNVADASPAGLTIIGNTAVVAALKGQSILTVDLSTRASQRHLTGTVGRIREVTAGPNNTLWFTTSNGDGIGKARAGDDRIVSISLRVSG